MPKTLDNATLTKRAQARLNDLYRDDAQMRAARPDGAVRARAAKTGSTVEAVATFCEAYSERPALGQRLDGARDFETITYGELWQRAKALASAFQAGDEPLVKEQDLVGIIGFPSTDHIVSDFACLYLNAAANSLAVDFSHAELEQIINEGPFSCVVASWKSLDKVLNVLPTCPSVRSVVVTDVPKGAAVDAKLAQVQESFAARERKLLFTTIAALEQQGLEHGLVPYVIPKSPDALRMLCYTSGSTGFPKGAIFSERLMHGYWTEPFMGPETGDSAIPQISVAFSPLNHIMGQFGIFRVLSAGGTQYFTAKSDMSTLFEDMRLTRPTSVDLVPRVAEMIFQHFQTEVIRRSRGKSAEQTKGLEAEVKAQMRHGFLGDRLLTASIGSAPSSLEVRNFIKDCFEIPLAEGYGMTEIGYGTIDGQIVGQFVSDYKLIDVPELGYRVTDKPYPRGALCIKSRRAVSGYYKNEKATKELFDADGFLLTGDIFEERASGELAYIDRVKNVLKLSQGEFVTIWRLESLFEQASPYIKQVYLYGNSSRAYLLGVVVPQQDYVDAHFAAAGKAVSADEVQQLLRRELNRIAKEGSLRAFEVPRDFLVEAEPFSTENGLLTSIKKNARPNLKSRYGEQLEALYAAIERKQLEDLALLADAGRDTSPELLVTKALEATLGISGGNLPVDAVFADLGGDSLSAVALATTLESLCGVSVAVSFLLSPATTVRDLIAKVGAQLAGAEVGGQITVASIHGEDAATIRAEDLRISRFLTNGEVDAAKRLVAEGVAKDPKTFFLTGATGWLGRFLCMELLESVARRGGRVFTIVRAASDEKAATRLRAVFLTDPVLQQRYDQLASRHLVVLAGDLEQANFGLSAERFAMLAGEVDAIVHPGALVNHVYTYSQLFQANVLGTVEIIRLALAKRLKAITYVSTIGVLGGAAHTGMIKEDEDVRQMAPVWHVNPAAYAQGYGISKWAGEVLLRDLRDQLEIPINVFRPDMIMPHQKYRGQINESDMITRFLASLVYTGIAPKSFYARRPGDGEPHFDGLPGDFIAAAMVGIALKPEAKFATYNVSNPYLDDGVSLDSIADWVRTAGYPVAEISDHGLWFQMFKQRLTALAPNLKANSSLPIVHMWEEASPVYGEVRPDVERFIAKVGALGQTVPHLSEGFIHKYLRDMVDLNMIQAPSQASDLPNPPPPGVRSSMESPAASST